MKPGFVISGIRDPGCEELKADLQEVPMKRSDPGTWPKNLSLSYWRISHALVTAHAVYKNQGKGICSVVLSGPERRVIPTKGYTRLCGRCIHALRAWGYLSSSEAVEE